MVEDDALGIHTPCGTSEPITDIRMPAVVFIPDKDGKMRTRPLDVNTDLPTPNPKEASA